MVAVYNIYTIYGYKGNIIRNKSNIIRRNNIHIGEGINQVLKQNL